MKALKQLFILGVMALAPSLYAQGQPTGGEESVGNVEVRVFERYEATVRSPNKLTQQPDFQDTTTKKLNVTYDFTPRIVETNVELDPIPAAQIARTRTTRLPENMVKLGIGNYITPEFSMILANSRSNSTSWSVAVDHFSTATGALRDYSVFNDNYTMNNQLRAGIENVNTRWRFKADLDVSLRDISYYGVPRVAGVNENLYETEPMRQRYYQYGLATRYERTTNRGNDPFRGVGLNYHFLHDRYGAAEHFVKGMADWTIPLQDVDLYLGTGADYLNYASDSGSTSSYAIRLKPYIRKETNGIFFTVGLNLAYVGSNVSMLNPTTEDKPGGAYLYPILKAELPLVRDVLNIFGGWEGDVDLNGLSGISQMNPYIAPGVEIRETGVNKIYAGFSGRISRRFGYNLQADYFLYKNKAMFVRDSTDLYSGVDPYVNLIYTNLGVLSPRVELTYHHPSGVEFSADASYFLYNRPDDQLTYHLPDFKGGLHVSYDWKNKIVAKTDFTVTGPRLAYGSNDKSEEATLPTFYDWRIYLEYRYNDYINFYISGNNLLNQKYFLWYGYPAQGIRGILGITVRF